MKPIVFSNHALTRLTRMEFHKNPAKNKPIAEKMLTRARKIYVEPGGLIHYLRGVFKFIVNESGSTRFVVTMMRVYD